MIRINLLTAEPETAARQAAPIVQSEARIAQIAAGVLILTAFGLGAWFWMLHREGLAVDAELAQTTSRIGELKTTLVRVERVEARAAELRQRVTLIEQLRSKQSAPARLLDQISRSVPDDLWLADLTQTGSEFTIAGLSRSMTALSDFVAGLESTGWFRRPVEIVDSVVSPDATAGDLVRFVVKASYLDKEAGPLSPARAGTP